ncbi:MAG: hypothetical protein ATN34_02410 [Epulopiscium sp. Nele67-Bin002]|nr:MAG: hypothetical protein ATN34_02410 [Epulopiscium sp. Nele67-Bin002]OON91853.1 MAG: hypothetical protein ATN33_08455 [Epulopiscium sp. Nele67-Bin001]
MSEILLNTGTGEVEVVEFVVNDKHYAINVLKIKGIVTIDSVTPLPNAKEEIAGLTNIRGDMDVVIDLSYVLHGVHTVDYSKTLGLLCEFNETQVVFLVNQVDGIRRISWNDIKQSNNVRHDTLSIGSLMIDGVIIILLDFESITIKAGIGKMWEANEDTGPVQPKTQKLVVVEDSRAIREMLKCVLEEAGYCNIRLFDNGQSAKDYILEIRHRLGPKFRQEVELVITDIEMPILDGYSLTRAIKEDHIIRELPVVIFSSLITEELQHKGIEIGADAQLSKPSMAELVRIVNMMFGN